MARYRALMLCGVTILILSGNCRDRGDAPQPAGKTERPVAGSTPHFVTSLPADVRQVLAEPATLRIFRVANPVATPRAEYEELRRTKARVAEYPVLAEAPADPPMAQELGSLLLNAESYLDPGEEWMCIFEPGYVAQLARDDRKIDVVICFKCGEIFIRGGRNQITPVQGMSKHGLTQLERIIRSVLREAAA